MYAAKRQRNALGNFAAVFVISVVCKIKFRACNSEREQKVLKHMEITLV